MIYDENPKRDIRPYICKKYTCINHGIDCVSANVAQEIAATGEYYLNVEFGNPAYRKRYVAFIIFKKRLTLQYLGYL